MFLGKKNKPEIQKVDLRDYIKFILKKGTNLEKLEKREILDSLKGKLILNDREIFLEK
jgi:inorganic pyrophosphatase/exopolyphosphatase